LKLIFEIVHCHESVKSINENVHISLVSLVPFRNGKFEKEIFPSLILLFRNINGKSLDI